MPFGTFPVFPGRPGPASYELFYLLEDHGIIKRELTEKMVRAMGFRNLVVHEYGKVDHEIVFRASRDDVNDLREFARALTDRFG